MYRIYIVEDDATISGVMKAHLEGWGYQVRCAEDFREVLAEFIAFRPQLVLLDITLPHRSGFYWCERLREISQVPILFISSAGDAMSMVTAMNMGADDFIAKPFELHLLVAKTRALLRRAYEFGDTAELVEHRGVILSLGDSTAHFEGNRVELTRNEHRILHALMLSHGRTVSREELMQRLWESDSYVDDNTLTVNINRLRKKLEEAGIVDFVRTQKGAGYRVE